MRVDLEGELAVHARTRPGMLLTYICDNGFRPPVVRVVQSRTAVPPASADVKRPIDSRPRPTRRLVPQLTAISDWLTLILAWFSSAFGHVLSAVWGIERTVTDPVGWLVRPARGHRARPESEARCPRALRPPTRLVRLLRCIFRVPRPKGTLPATVARPGLPTDALPSLLWPFPRDPDCMGSCVSR